MAQTILLVLYYALIHTVINICKSVSCNLHLHCHVIMNRDFWSVFMYPGDKQEIGVVFLGELKLSSKNIETKYFNCTKIYNQGLRKELPL